MARAARGATLIALGALLVALLAGCGSSGSDTAESAATATTVTTTEVPPTTVAPVTATTTAPPVRKVFAPGTFDATDALLEQRVRAAGLAGAIVRIVDFDGDVIHEHEIGRAHV